MILFFIRRLRYGNQDVPSDLVFLHALAIILILASVNACMVLPTMMYSGSTHTPIINPIFNVCFFSGLSLDLSMANTNPYDEPSISAALDALDQDANALATLP